MIPDARIQSEALMKKIVLGFIVLLTLCDIGYARTINVDGDINDWSGINPLINEGMGSLRVTNDTNNLYMLSQTYLLPIESYFAIDADRNKNTGLKAFGLGAENWFLLYGYAPPSHNNFAADGSRANLDINPGDIVAKYGNSYLEYSISMSYLRQLAPNTNAIDIVKLSPECDPSAIATYMFEEMVNPPIENIATERINSNISGLWNKSYDISFDNGKLQVDVKIFLDGDKPDEFLVNTWEKAIEGVWSNQYDIVDGNNIYKLGVNVDFVDDKSIANQVVTVHDGKGNPNTLNWYTNLNTFSNDQYQSQIAAHEFGHMMGLYDEYSWFLGHPTLDPNNPIEDNKSIMGAGFGDIILRSLIG